MVIAQVRDEGTDIELGVDKLDQVRLSEERFEIGVDGRACRSYERESNGKEERVCQDVPRMEMPWTCWGLTSNFQRTKTCMSYVSSLFP